MAILLRGHYISLRILSKYEGVNAGGGEKTKIGLCGPTPVVDLLFSGDVSDDVGVGALNDDCPCLEYPFSPGRRLD
jgi:hypothetical protein